jgi:ferritin
MNNKLNNLNEMQVAAQESILTPYTISQEVVKMLIERIGDEYTAHYFYRNASNWCKEKAYFRAAAFFAAEADTELTHAQKVQDYLVDWNVMPIIPPVSMIPQFSNLIDIVNKAYELEYGLFTSYNENSAVVFPADMATFDFLQELRIIQRTSVAEYSDLLNAAMLVNVSNNFEVLYFEQTYFPEVG